MVKIDLPSSLPVGSVWAVGPRSRSTMARAGISGNWEVSCILITEKVINIPPPVIIVKTASRSAKVSGEVASSVEREVLEAGFFPLSVIVMRVWTRSERNLANRKYWWGSYTAQTQNVSSGDWPYLQWSYGWCSLRCHWTTNSFV